MKFKILSAIHMQQLNRTKKADSHLALGVFYIQVGMVPQAEREFQVLVQHNPRSTTAVKLLREIQS